MVALILKFKLYYYIEIQEHTRSKTTSALFKTYQSKP